jgi:hypothetical protein
VHPELLPTRSLEEEEEDGTFTCGVAILFDTRMQR